MGQVRRLLSCRSNRRASLLHVLLSLRLDAYVLSCGYAAYCAPRSLIRQ